MKNQQAERIPQTLIGFFWSARREYAFGLCIALSRILIICWSPLILKRMLDRDMALGDWTDLLLMSLLSIAMLFGHQLVMVTGSVMLGRAVSGMTFRLRKRVFDKIHDLSFSYLDRTKAGQLLSKYSFDTQKIDGMVMPTLNGFLPNSLYSLLTFAVLIYLDWRLSLAILLLLPILAVIRSLYFKRMQKQHEVNRVTQEKLTGIASEYLGATRLVRSYGREEKASLVVGEQSQHVADERVKMVRLGASFGAFTWASQQFLMVTVVAGGVMLAIFGKVTAGTVVAFVSALPALVQPIQMFANIADQWFLGAEAYRSVRELLLEKEVEQWQGTRRLESISGQIEFDHVNFRYSGATRDAISDFSIKINAGEKVAFVGSSGAGKSTVSGLLLGLYAPGTGTIRIDGVPLHDLDVRWMRRQAALVMQESLLLSGTISDNIRFAEDDASEEDVLRAARLAHATEFIERLPEGFKTVIGERGVMLSGGQRQRISIARAILRDPAILILDEPTSALDYESERLIQDALDELVKGRTVITIAHRLSTIRNSDRIVVMHEGKVVEQGTFDDLISRQGHFHRMLASQSPDGMIGDGPSIHAA